MAEQQTNDAYFMKVSHLPQLLYNMSIRELGATAVFIASSHREKSGEVWRV